MLRPLTVLAIALPSLVATAAVAHVTLDQPEATVGGSYKAVLRVPHGCEGSATTEIRAKVPEGFIGVKPMPKPGWTVETVKGPYEKAYTLYGTEVSEGVTEVVWSGGNLPDDFYDEFTMRGTLAGDLPTDAPLYFPVVQTCAKGVDRWIEIPESGKSADDYEFPAPGLTLLPKS